MCNGFGLIVDKFFNVYFVEPDGNGNCSHSDILLRLGWRENVNRFLRNFVRVEFSNWTPGSFSFDEDSSLPGWVEENKQGIKDKCVRTLELCAPALAEYKKVRGLAWAEYEKVRGPALAEYKKVRGPALAEYEKVRGPALAEFVATLSKIKGYVEELK
jgi:hypothetical protein